jgi:hypothetical protein
LPFVCYLRELKALSFGYCDNQGQRNYVFLACIFFLEAEGEMPAVDILLMKIKRVHRKEKSRVRVDKRKKETMSKFLACYNYSNLPI